MTLQFHATMDRVAFEAVSPPRDEPAERVDCFGIDVARVEIDPAGKILIVVTGAAPE